MHWCDAILPDCYMFAKNFSCCELVMGSGEPATPTQDQVIW